MCLHRYVAVTLVTVLYGNSVASANELPMQIRTNWESMKDKLLGVDEIKDGRSSERSDS